MTNYTAFLTKDRIERFEGKQAKDNLKMAMDNPNIWQWQAWDKHEIVEYHIDDSKNHPLHEQYRTAIYDLIDLVADRLASVVCFKSSEGYHLDIFIHEERE